MTSRAIIAPVLVASFLPLIGDALACTCIGTPFERAYKTSDFVVAGTVVGRLAPSPNDRVRARGTASHFSGADMIRWTIIPIASWKGEAADTIYVYSEESGASCGYSFVVGDDYLVFGRIRTREFSQGIAYAGGATLPVRTVGLCSHTAPLGAAALDLELLGPAPWERTEQ